MNKGALLRFITACICCLTVIFYNGARIITPINTKNEITDMPLFIEEQAEKEAAKKEEKAEENNQKEQEKTEGKTEKEENKAQSSPVSADAVKGKILSQYISPYSAPLAYNKVYMKNNTELDISIKSLLEEKLSFEIEQNESPQVLIIHTHTTETFMTEKTDYYTENFKSRTIDNSKNMAKIGEIVAEKLNKAGIKTIHDKTQHDYPQYSGSYTRAAKTITSYLKKYPTIKVVLDLHRDAVTSGKSDKVKLVTEIDGKKAAQVMLVMGSQSGTVTNFTNYKENLKLAVRLQQIFEKKYPTLARPLSLMSKNYNESLTNGSMLIEFGTDANTLEEACYSAQLVGNCLAELLNKI